MNKKSVLGDLYQFTITGVVTEDKVADVQNAINKALKSIPDIDTAKVKVDIRKAFVNTELQKQSAIPVELFGPTTIQTRYCPDHPGVMVIRITDSIYQCPEDGKVYDYYSGFKTRDDKQYSGGSVAEQTPSSPEFYQSPRKLLR